MGGDEIWDAVSEHLGVGHDETTADGTITLERIECNAACDFAPVVMTNWEFFDNQTPASTIELVDALRAGEAGRAPPAARQQVGTFKEVSRVLAGFPDGLADEGVGAGPGIPGRPADRAASRAGPPRRATPRTPAPAAAPRAPRAAPRSRPTTTRPRPTRPPRRRRPHPPPGRPRQPGAPVASTGDGVSGVAREVPSPDDTVDPVPPQESEPDEAGRAANVSAQSASVPDDPPAPPRRRPRRRAPDGDDAHADPQRLLGRPEVLDPRHLHAPRRLPGPRQGAGHGAGRHHRGRQGLLRCAAAAAPASRPA